MRFLLANSAARSGVAAGVESLRRGRPLLDVLDTVLRAAESDREERSVGLGGRPNLLGEVELDASVMEGATRRSGSVGALRGFLHPVSIARAVMERLPHVFLAGEGAARFAREIGAEAGSLLTAESEEEWRKWLEGNLPARAEPAGAVRSFLADPHAPLAELVWRTVQFEKHRDTAVALISDGVDLVSGTTTCGWPFKYPGRLGDSALVGSGHYADSRFGAAACTHTGEMAIRAGSARYLVFELQQGMSPEQACAAALADARELRGGLLGGLVVHAADPRGAHFVASSQVAAEYWWWSDGMAEAAARPASSL